MSIWPDSPLLALPASILEGDFFAARQGVVPFWYWSLSTPMAAAEELAGIVACEAVVVTRSEEGMSLYAKGEPPVHVPAYALLHRKRTAHDLSCVVSDLFGNLIETEADWLKICDAAYWDYFLIPTERVGEWKNCFP